jgi:hypothetical protein
MARADARLKVPSAKILKGNQMLNPMIPAAGGAMPFEGHKTRRALLRLFGAAPLAVLPAVAALAMPAPAVVDPIFAAIERHKAARLFYKEENRAIKDWATAQVEKRPGWKKNATA